MIGLVKGGSIAAHNLLYISNIYILYIYHMHGESVGKLKAPLSELIMHSTHVQRLTELIQWAC